jgi:type II secretory pathway component PulF
MAADKKNELDTKKFLNMGGHDAFQDDVLLAEEHLAFYRLAKMLELGMPVLSSLKFVIQETRHESLKQAFSEIAQRIEAGDGLSENMNKPLFAPSIIAMVSVGEITGRLAAAMLAISECLEKQLSALRKRR